MTAGTGSGTMLLEVDGLSKRFGGGRFAACQRGA